MAFARQPEADEIDGRKTCNGFFTCDEPPSIVVAGANIADFTLPEEALSFKPSKDITVHQFANGDSERKLHCNTELSDVESGHLQSLQEMARKDNTVFYPSMCSAATRYISRARGDIHKALTLMLETQQWRESYFGKSPIVDESIKDDLRHGICYFTGRDKDLRPTLVCRANRIPAEWMKSKATDKLIRIVIFCMEYMVRYMMKPGAIEGNNLIIDLKGIGPTQVPFAELKKIYSVTSHHYLGRVFKFYILNMSVWFKGISSLVMGLLTDRQRQKICILNSASDLKKDYALHQLESDLGGSRPICKDFFPFPLEPGPFEAGHSRGPHAKAIRCVHEVFTVAGFRGRLWNVNKSREENTQMEFAAGAAAIFRKCGLEVPAQLVEEENELEIEKPVHNDVIENGKPVTSDVIENGAAVDSTKLKVLDGIHVAKVEDPVTTQVAIVENQTIEATQVSVGREESQKDIAKALSELEVVEDQTTGATQVSRVGNEGKGTSTKEQFVVVDDQCIGATQVTPPSSWFSYFFGCTYCSCQSG
eukprot:TRINITY_DN6685_c0_g2_i1.p1 TRINITY_DN6685_c0_g2~~TRINITY_DN6685_c0_g2_i1.p1  ORF type:complete len:534 (+),score=79.37 TRINITY_DN6685_c0_g2_i1:49-1650(+)